MTRSGIAAMRRIGLAGIAFAAIGIATLPALAWTPPVVGQACSGTRGAGPVIERISGNFLGGRHMGGRIVGPTDYRSFQGCFRTVEACERWLADKSIRFPLAPGYARCTLVTLR